MSGSATRVPVPAVLSQSPDSDGGTRESLKVVINKGRMDGRSKACHFL